ncbi:MAG: hypothetical protein ACOX6D_06690 [Thermoguttaceae bacterium]|jgi:hypothetical protein
MNGNKHRCGSIGTCTMVCGILFSCWLSLSCGSVMAAPDDISLADLCAKIETALSEYMEHAGSLQMNITTDTDGDSDTDGKRPTTMVTDHTYFSTEDDLTTSDGVIDAGKRVLAFNKSYFFMIDGNPVNNEWRIVRLTEHDTGIAPIKKWLTDPNRDVQSPLGRYRTYYLPFILIGTYTVLDVLKHPCFRQESIVENADGTTRISFKADPPDDEEAPFLPMLEGSVNLTPDYLVKDASLIQLDGNSFSVDNEYSDENQLKERFLVKHTETLKNSEKTFSKRTWTIDTEILPKLPKNRFKFSYYGLPEPDFGEGKPHGLRALLVLLGSVLILFALYRGYKKTRSLPKGTPQ